MIMNAVLAIALGLTPAQPGKSVETIYYNDKDYAGMIGSYRESTDAKGTTYLRGFDRITGKPFEIAVRANGDVEGTVGDSYIAFNARQAI